VREESGIKKMASKSFGSIITSTLEKTWNMIQNIHDNYQKEKKEKEEKIKQMGNVTT
jgi:hypothetical protein